MRQHPRDTWTRRLADRESPERGGVSPDAPTGRGRPGDQWGACAGGEGAGSGPGIPVAAAVFSGARAPSARSGPLWQSGVTLERLRPQGG